MPASSAPSIGVVDVDAGDLSAFAHLTFPAVRKAVAPFLDRTFAVGAMDGDVPVGLALGMAGPAQDFELLSVFVPALMRRQGIGSALLSALERRFSAQGVQLGIHHLTVEPHHQDSVRFLMANGWARPVMTKLICHSTMENAFRTPWLIRATVPERYAIVDWGSVRADAQQAIEAGIGTWVPEDLNPYAFEEGCHAPTSVALVDKAAQDAVRGWVITHLIDEDTLRWTCSFVDETVQSSGRIVPLWLECAKRQRAMNGPQRFMYSIPVERPRMAQFAVRRMRPWLTGLFIACTTHKRLA
ncbi:MAG: GNAT family N-acetyltransferase [Pseudomonadota bacterium]